MARFALLPGSEIARKLDPASCPERTQPCDNGDSMNSMTSRSDCTLSRIGGGGGEGWGMPPGSRLLELGRPRAPTSLTLHGLSA